MRDKYIGIECMHASKTKSKYVYKINCKRAMSWIHKCKLSNKKNSNSMAKRKDKIKSIRCTIL